MGGIDGDREERVDGERVLCHKHVWTDGRPGLGVLAGLGRSLWKEAKDGRKVAWVRGPRVDMTEPDGRVALGPESDVGDALVGPRPEGRLDTGIVGDLAKARGGLPRHGRVSFRPEVRVGRGFPGRTGRLVRPLGGLFQTEDKDLADETVKALGKDGKGGDVAVLAEALEDKPKDERVVLHPEKDRDPPALEDKVDVR